MQKVCFQRVWFELYGCFERTQVVFLAYAENGFSSETTLRWHHRWAWPSKKVRYCLTDPMIPTVTLELNPFRRHGRSKVCQPL